MPKEKDVFVPDPEDLRIWEEYINRPDKIKPVIDITKYKRRRKRDRRRRAERPSPCVRGFRSVMVRRSTYEMLFEMKQFYKKSFTYILHEMVRIAYEKTYRQAELLARIDANRIKDEQALKSDKPRRRYNV